MTSSFAEPETASVSCQRSLLTPGGSCTPGAMLRSSLAATVSNWWNTQSNPAEPMNVSIGAALAAIRSSPPSAT